MKYLDFESDPGAGTRAPIGERLHALRTDTGLSQREIGRRLARPNSIVSRWESGAREPSVFDLAALARVLKIDVNDLLDGVEPAARGRRWSNRAYGWRLRVAFGRRLALARIAAGMSRLDVLERTGIRGLRLARLEAGADPSVAELVALRDLYGFDVAAAVRASNLDSRQFLTMVPPARLHLTDDPLEPRTTVDGSNPLTMARLSTESSTDAAETGASTQLTVRRERSSGNRRVATVGASPLARTRTDRCDPALIEPAPSRPTSRRSPCAIAA